MIPDDEPRAHDIDVATKLMKIEPGTLLAACWHLDVEIDLRDRRKTRVEQKALLARYGRIPWHAWDGRPVSEINEALTAIGEVVAKEAPEVVPGEHNG